MQAHAPHGPERPQPLHHVRLGLLDDDDVPDQQDQDQHHQDQQGDPLEHIHHIHTASSFFSGAFRAASTMSFTPSIRRTSTRLPAGSTVPSALRAVQVLPST